MKPKRIRRFMFGAAMLASGVVYGDTASPTHDECLQQAVSTVDIVTCITDEYERQDQRLNENYQQLRSQLSSARREQLLTAQRAWIQYKEANCDFYFDPEGGTLARVSANSCVLNETRERADELEKLMQH
ncbi:lysozyme inhibitor LprI family protein [Halomonas sp. Bachu 37]|uniref:lysozyme inhibitor LprI family protein n=1 Tax=Halomonas kashgarensis TaxID=3084920 RepID=UPI003216D6EB